MFALLNVNTTIEINVTHLFADTIAVAYVNADSKCERALIGIQMKSNTVPGSFDVSNIVK